MHIFWDWLLKRVVKALMMGLRRRFSWRHEKKSIFSSNWIHVVRNSLACTSHGREDRLSIGSNRSIGELSGRIFSPFSRRLQWLKPRQKSNFSTRLGMTRRNREEFTILDHLKMCKIQACGFGKPAEHNSCGLSQAEAVCRWSSLNASCWTRHFACRRGHFVLPYTVDY